MLRKLVFTRVKEVRHGWSYRAFPWEIELDGVLIGTVSDGETVSFLIDEKEQLMDVWMAGIIRTRLHSPHGMEVIPPGNEECRVTGKQSAKIELTIETGNQSETELTEKGIK